MQRRLIPDLDHLALKTATSSTFAAERERVRTNTSAPLAWRLCPSLTAFYNPEGMTQAEMDAYDASQRAEQRDKELALKALAALATAVHKRIKALIPADTTTAAQWKAAIVAEWDAL